MSLPQSTTPEDDVIALQLRDERGTIICELTTFREYEFAEHYLTPTSRFSFVIGDEALTKSILDGIYVGQMVTLSINRLVQAGGFIDKLVVSTSRSSGTELHVEGRDWLSPAVDANIDPIHNEFSRSETLLDLIIAVFSPYGFGGIGQIISDNDANRNVITGQNRGDKTSKKGKTLKSFQAHQIKPYPHEGAFGFASRITQRHGLWIRASADGQTLTVASPDFSQKSIYSIKHKLGVNDASGNNVLNSSVSRNGSEQPTVIVATGFGGGGEFGRSNLKVAMLNALTAFGDNNMIRPEAQAVLANYPDAPLVGFTPDDPTTGFSSDPNFFNLEAIAVGNGISNKLNRARFRAMYLNDDESKTLEELEGFVQREMALKQRDAITASYTFEGHTCKGVPWCVDAIADVDDDVSGLHTQMWVMSRTFMKSRGGGTHTHVELILPYTMDFG